MSKAKTHWLKNPNKNFLGHWDLPNGKDLILTIESAKWEFIENPKQRGSDGKPIKEERRIIRWKEKGFKPMICNETNAKSIVKSTGVNYLEDSKGSRIKLYVGKYDDRRNKETVDCIRVRSEERMSEEEIFKKIVSLYDQLKTSITAEESEAIKRIIDNEETLSYQKAFNFLTKTKNG